MSLINDRISSLRYTSVDGWMPTQLQVIGETSLKLSVNGLDWISFLCTPKEQVELACGFLYNEGFLESATEIADSQLCPDGSHVDLWLTHKVEHPERWKRTSGCGGGATHQDVPIPQATEWDGPPLEPRQILTLMEELLEGQALYHETGGIHSSAICDGRHILHQCEDIGRHNTLDKLAGHLLLAPNPLERRVILTTGRISSEMLQKTARIGADVVVSRTSPTNESVRLAEQAGITLIGYARRSQMIVYTHPGRLRAS